MPIISSNISRINNTVFVIKYYFLSCILQEIRGGNTYHRIRPELTGIAALNNKLLV